MGGLHNDLFCHCCCCVSYMSTLSFYLLLLVGRCVYCSETVRHSTGCSLDEERVVRQLQDSTCCCLPAAALAAVKTTCCRCTAGHNCPPYFRMISVPSDTHILCTSYKRWLTAMIYFVLFSLEPPPLSSTTDRLLYRPSSLII